MPFIIFFDIFQAQLVFIANGLPITNELFHSPQEADANDSCGDTHSFRALGQSTLHPEITQMTGQKNNRTDICTSHAAVLLAAVKTRDNVTDVNPKSWSASAPGRRGRRRFTAGLRPPPPRLRILCAAPEGSLKFTLSGEDMLVTV